MTSKGANAIAVIISGSMFAANSAELSLVV